MPAGWRSRRGTCHTPTRSIASESDNITISGQQIRIAASDGGEFGAYVALPPETSAPGIIMLHEIFGVTDWIKETADYFAGQGFCVIAPEMFWRLEPDFVADHNDPAQTEKGRQRDRPRTHRRSVQYA